MSSYLLALVIGELTFVEGAVAGSGTPVQVYAPASQPPEHGQAALEAGTKVLAYYEQFFGSAFPLPKIDMVAIPDFAAGAMENWGLVTYRTTALLVDPAKSSERDRQRVAVVVAHELAHQWFGDLISCRDWNHAWLHEGFATYFDQLWVEESQGVDHLHLRLKEEADGYFIGGPAPWLSQERAQASGLGAEAGGPGGVGGCTPAATIAELKAAAGSESTAVPVGSSHRR